MNFLKTSLYLPFILAIFVSIFFIPLFILNSENYSFTYSKSSITFNNSLTFTWPTPGYRTITSKFGKRVAPATGAATYHGGTDIGAPQGSKIVSIEDGVVTFAGWNGANGYTVIIKHNDDYKSLYGHVSPNLIVTVGEKIFKGQTIAYVGPKYVEQKSYTTYKDSSGKYTNGATTGPHLHFSLIYKNSKVDPMNYY